MNVVVIDIRERSAPALARAITNACPVLVLPPAVTAPEIKLAAFFRQSERVSYHAQFGRNPYVATPKRPPKSLGVRR